jgi:hypothetical protein
MSGSGSATGSGSGSATGSGSVTGSGSGTGSKAKAVEAAVVAATEKYRMIFPVALSHYLVSGFVCKC